MTGPDLDRPFPATDGVIQRMIRERDWSDSPLGPPESWDPALKSAVALMLDSRFPMFVAWGEELGFLYNEAYVEVLGAKHPRALGRRFHDIWFEIWDDIYPLIKKALNGEASWQDDLPLTMQRSDYFEDTWFTFSYSPLRDSEGTIRGLFCACTETTDKVLAIRSNQAERKRLENLFEQAPGFMAMFSGPEHTFQLANQAYGRLIGQRDVLGLPIREALPDLEGQGFFELLDSVYQTGRPFVGRRQLVRLIRTVDGTFEERYVDFIYQPVVDSEGRVTGIFAEGYDVTEQHAIESRLETQAKILETINRTTATLLSELDVDRIVQQVTDSGVSLIGAQFGAFFYNQIDENGEALVLYSLSGADRDQFDGFGHPRATQIFKPTFDGTEIIRSADVTQDPRYGHSAPHFGMPRGHLPVKSYLAVPVNGRSGEVLGGLFFGHEEPGRFTAEHEEVIAGIASQAAIAFRNAQLFREAQLEIAQRKESERHQDLLIHELNHRVKNSLAIVQGLAQQTFKRDRPMDEARAAFDARLGALAAAHDLLTRRNWQETTLHDIVATSVAATAGEAAGRITIEGPDVKMAAQTAVSFAMAIHELSTNAIKYGALSSDDGRIEVSWAVTEAAGKPRLAFEWREIDGPPVVPPQSSGFGSRMIRQGLAAEMKADVEFDYRPDGLRCTVNAPLPRA